jgi:hypothetical protein
VYMKAVTYISLFAVAAAVLITTTSSSHQPPTVTPPKPAQGIALLELFTSQGCSSCPPADDLLGEYARTNDQQVIPIAFHVDYWNRLGWKDPFSNPLFSERQREYAQHFVRAGVYTPQAVVNGTWQMVGSDEAVVATAIARAKSVAPLVGIAATKAPPQGGKVRVAYTLTGQYAQADLCAVLVQHHAKTNIRAGENRGVELLNYNIARDFTSTNAVEKGHLQLTLPPDVSVSDYSVVLFVQQADGKVIGVQRI